MYCKVILTANRLGDWSISEVGMVLEFGEARGRRCFHYHAHTYKQKNLRVSVS